MQLQIFRKVLTPTIDKRNNLSVAWIKCVSFWCCVICCSSTSLYPSSPLRTMSCHRTCHWRSSKTMEPCLICPGNGMYRPSIHMMVVWICLFTTEFLVAFRVRLGLGPILRGWSAFNHFFSILHVMHRADQPGRLAMSINKSDHAARTDDSNRVFD